MRTGEITGEHGYLRLIRDLMAFGEKRDDRTETGTKSLFGRQLRFDFEYEDNVSFPLFTTKRIFFRGVVIELLWFLKGSTNIKYLVDNDVHIWDEWADEEGNLGPVYGKQWRSWRSPNNISIDQIKEVIDSIKNNPYSRRHIVSAWNVGEIKDMALPPCHMFFQFYVSREKYLQCHVYMRSADIFLGVPFNVASYSLLTKMIAHVTGLTAERLIITFGDVHLYDNHEKQANILLERTVEAPPSLYLNQKIKDIDDFKFKDIRLKGYKPNPAISAPIAV